MQFTFSVREDKSTVKKAAYVVLGVDQKGKKDILITCVDGLTGFKEAIQAVYLLYTNLCKLQR